MDAEAPFLRGPDAVDAALAGRLLSTALAHGGDLADLFFEFRRTLHLSLEEGRVRSAGGAVDVGMGARVVCDGAVGYAYAERLDPRSLVAAARGAARIARVRGGKLRRARAVAGPLAGVAGAGVADASGAAYAALLRRADEAARRVSPAIVRVDASLSVIRREILVVPSDGPARAEIQPLVRVSVAATAERARRRETGTSAAGGRRGFDWLSGHVPEDLGEEAGRAALVGLDSRPAPAGSLPVVLAPGDAGIWLHEAVGHGLEADFVRRGASVYAGRLGERVAAEKVTIVDDPGLAGAPGSLTVDDEGAAAGPRALIERGVLRGLLCDRVSAGHFAAPAGAGRRQSFRDAPLPRMSNTLMLAGEDDPEDIVRSVRFGVYAARFSGGQVNLGGGDFVFAVTEGYLIEDGRLTAPLRGVNLIGNGPAALAAVSMVGGDARLSSSVWTCTKEGQNLFVGVGMPTVKIDRLTVGGTTLGRGG